MASKNLTKSTPSRRPIPVAAKAGVTRSSKRRYCGGGKLK